MDVEQGKCQPVVDVVALKSAGDIVKLILHMNILSVYFFRHPLYVTF